MTGAATALAVLTLRRSTPARVAGTLLAIGVPVLAAAFLGVARSDGSSMLAMKVKPMLVGTGWESYLGLVAQLESVAVLLAVGVVVCWTLGREHADRTFGALFALPTPRWRIAAARMAVLTGWGLGLCLLAIAVCLPLGLALGLGAPDAGALAGLGRVMVVGGLTVLLTLPLGWVSSVLRGYLPGISALLGVVVLTQVVTVLGAGAWFPYAAPGMWSGMGGAQAAAGVSWVQLALSVPVGLLGALATAWEWHRAEVV